MSILPYQLSIEADIDLDEIYDYSETKFGQEQAVSYLKKLEELFVLLNTHPEMGRERNEIEIGLRSFPHGSHVIYYRKIDEQVRIVRVLHGSRDILSFFE